MALKETQTTLHLPDLQVKGFRGIDDLTIPRLGRVTLLTGKNGVGKTTVLEAVEAYAARGRYETLLDILRRREESATTVDEDGDRVRTFSGYALFHGRAPEPLFPVALGPASGIDRLEISILKMPEQPSFDNNERDFPKAIFGRRQQITSAYAGSPAIVIGDIDEYGHFAPNRHAFAPYARRVRGSLDFESELTRAIPLERLGPGLINNGNLATMWDGVALTDDAQLALKALRLIYGDGIEGVAMVGEEPMMRSDMRRAIVKLETDSSPVPLKSLGDGALRFFGTALALASARGGFLLIDEVENGIHYTVQSDYWRMIFAAARDNNVQVLATTHSWDCVKGFADAANEDTESEGIAIRLERKNGRLRAVEYTEEDLAVAAEHNIEIR